MDSSIKSISDFLNNAKTVASAGFSAGYGFDAEKAANHFDEIIMASPDSPIFSGILIIERRGDSYTIVDGIQRVTTICLLLCALCESYSGTSQKNEEAKNKIRARFLLDQNQPKLKLKGKEQEVYNKILLSTELTEEEKDTNLFKTYATFLQKMQDHKVTGTDLFRIISRIQFMTILTDKSEVSVRELYQALNENKGKTQINLISDFIAQDEEASEKWQNIVDNFESLNISIESFLKDFLTTKTDKQIPNKGAIYNNFKNYYQKISKYQQTDEIMDNLSKYAHYYIKIINADFEDENIKEQINTLNKNDRQDTYPYLMEVLDDYENAHIDTEALLNILTMINLFIKSQQESAFSNINIDFASLSKELNKMLVLKDYVPKLIEEDKLTINVINNLSTFEV